MKRGNIRKAMRLLVPSAILSIFLYILLHEFGHVIVLWSVDADITNFSIVSAHVNYVGGEWTNASDRWMHLNGALFPLVLAVLYMLLYRREINNSFYRVFSGLIAIVPVASLMAWVIIPLIYMGGHAPEGDDVTKFLYNFTYDYPAYLVSIVALLVVIISIAIALWKGIPQNFEMEVRRLKNTTSEI